MLRRQRRTPMTEVTYERVLRGIPRWLLRGYLEDLGARSVEGAGSEDDLRGAASTDGDHDLLVAEGWRARLAQLEDYRIGSLRSGQVEMVVTGEPGVVDVMLAALEPRLFRGGG
jgi:hypothetical protein